MTMYCELADILAQVDRRKLIDLSNDDGEPVLDENGNPTINTANVNKAIEAAGSEIDSYASVRYQVPFSPVPPVIKKLAVDIAVYNLFSRKWTGEEEDNIILRYKNAVKLLEKIAEGKVQIGISENSLFYSAPAKVFGDTFRKEYD
ncbi:gp436 family protein [Neomoorella glycerini]|jgi:phage gp36-like protein|nr:DUF1320 domain-containing protein [Moorella glycerini]